MVIVLATISIIGISIIQVFWFRKAFLISEKQFNQSLHIALKSVAEKMPSYNQGSSSALVNPVNQLSSNYFVVMINDVIDVNILELLLVNEFEKRNIITDFEYGIYDCIDEKMVYGNYINNTQQDQLEPKKILPKWENENYYFGVYFPNKNYSLVSQMNIWLFSSLVLLLVIIFFSYTLFIILKQKRLSEIQRDFINNMTHEFKTPITTISISSEVLKDPDVIQKPQKLLSYATIIQEEAFRLKNQVERVLQMATADGETFKLKKEKIDIHKIIRENVDKCLLPVSEKKASIECDFTAKNAFVMGDVLHLSNAFYNLLDNALKYSHQLAHIKISTKNDKRGITIIFEDNGIGIPKDALNKVFEKFYRIPTGNLHDVKGFGLGLNYVKLVCKAHLGSIALTSKINEGSTFSIFLPCLTKM